MFRLYRGYATSSRAQAERNNSRLARELASNTASSIVNPTQGGSGAYYRATNDVPPVKALGGSYGQSGRVYRIEVAGIRQPGYPGVRRSSTAFIVPYEQLLPKLQQVKRAGGTVVSVNPA